MPNLQDKILTSNGPQSSFKSSFKQSEVCKLKANMSVAVDFYLEVVDTLLVSPSLVD